MVKAGMTSGAFRPSQPLDSDSESALIIWANLGADLRWPDVAYELELAGVADIELMLERLRTIRSTVAEHRTHSHG